VTYEVIGRKRKINFGATGVDEVLQNVAMILQTPKMTVPLRRSWFIDYSLLDKPIEVAQAQLASEVFQAIRKYEPRATITGIRFIQDNEQNMEGWIIPAVSVEVNL